MEIIKFDILIHADKQKVWDLMLGKGSYSEWTKPFHEGSDFEGSWEQGNEIRFTAPNKEGKLEGMFSRIKENIPYRFVSIEHLGFISNGIIDTTSDEVKKWTPSFENYTFNEIGENTEVKVEMQTAAEYKAMFAEMWPRALQALKVMCEK